MRQGKTVLNIGSAYLFPVVQAGNDFCVAEAGKTGSLSSNDLENFFAAVTKNGVITPFFLSIDDKSNITEKLTWLTSLCA